MAALPVHLLHGPEPSLLADAVLALVTKVVGDDDRTLVLHELSGEDYTVDELVDAAQTTPFLTPRRVVVARGLSRFTVAELGPLVSYLGDVNPTTELVLEWGSGRLPKQLTDAVKAAGGEKLTTGAPGNARGRNEWFEEQFSGAGLQLDRRAKQAMIDQLGEDVGRLSGLLATLVSAFGTAVKLSESDVEPFLGDAGGVPPWELTDAIDQGHMSVALSAAGRMLDAGARHPLQLMATLHSHYERMLRLDGAGVRDEKAAAGVLGMKGSTFPAKKAMAQGRRLGPTGVRQAIELLADADVDLRGRTGLEGRYVVEILVARLARLGR